MWNPFWVQGKFKAVAALQSQDLVEQEYRFLGNQWQEKILFGRKERKSLQ